MDKQHEKKKLEEGIEISTLLELLIGILEKIRNWKTLGLDGIQGFCLKDFTSIHYKQALQEPNVSKWVTNGKTYIDTEGPQKWNHPAQLLSDNLFTYGVERFLSRGKRGNLLH